MSNNNNSPNTAIDESLYSRQLYVLGHDAMKKMAFSNVLISGCGALATEIAKNIVLAGVKSVTLHDARNVSWLDLSANFFFSESDLGRNRAEVLQPSLAELNSYVPVYLHKQELRPEDLKKFQVVVVTETSLEEQIQINDECHRHGIAFISGDIFGLFGVSFNDFGDSFEVIDTTGENPVTGIVAAVSNDKEGVVTCQEETRHGLEDGDYVTFSEVKGMVELNNCKPRKVTVLGPYTFSIGDTTNLGSYISGGVFTQVKMPKRVQFLPLREAIKSPEFLVSDFAKFDRPAQLHLAIQALHKYKAFNKRLPRPRNEDDANELLKLTKEFNDQLESKVDISDDLIKELSYGARGNLSPMAAVMGGLLAQEVLKACSSKFMPIHQFFYFDSLESLPVNFKPVESECQEKGSRYDGQRAVLGERFQQQVQSTKTFLVGAGAIGCEMLKNWAMMGIATGENGHIYVTDMDTIEKSNLNRQFLFRSRDVGKLKSDCATSSVIKMNPQLSGRITAHQNRVGPDTEKIYGDDFFSNLNFVTNALDNVDARKYMDRRCVYYRKPLLESGTLGTKGNTQVILPHLTESYSSSQDPPEKSIPICTLKNFPNAIEHTIQWARDLFDGIFKLPAENVNIYLSQSNFVESTMKQGGNQKDVFENILKYLVVSKPLTFDECIVWARLKFEEYFNNTIRQLLFNFPKDSVTSSGAPFWSGPKRAPEPLHFNMDDETHMNFIISAANLHAFNYGLKGETDRQIFKRVLGNVMVPEFSPKQGVKIQVRENENVNEDLDSSELDKLIAQLPPPSQYAGLRLTPVEFEKDDDTNFHMDFITAASNLRAANYAIKPADRHNTKFIAGKIIPAIATTTALVTGLICLELYKIIDGRNKIEDYKNGFINLALPFFGFSEPIAAPKFKYHDITFTLWDRFDIEGDITLGEYLSYFAEKHQLEVTMLSYDASLLYSFFMPKKKVEDRKAMKLSKIIESISGKRFESNSFVLEMCVNDKDGEDVEVPYVRVVRQ